MVDESPFLIQVQHWLWLCLKFLNPVSKNETSNQNHWFSVCILSFIRFFRSAEIVSWVREEEAFVWGFRGRAVWLWGQSLQPKARPQNTNDEGNFPFEGHHLLGTEVKMFVFLTWTHYGTGRRIFLKCVWIGIMGKKTCKTLLKLKIITSFLLFLSSKPVSAPFLKAIYIM